MTDHRSGLAARLSDEKIDEYLAYLVDNDEVYAELKADVERKKIKAKRIEAIEYIGAAGPAQLRRYAVEMSPMVAQAWEQHAMAVQRFETMKNKRETCATLIEVWRTYTSAKKQGVHI